jgi:hypothetical protein
MPDDRRGWPTQERASSRASTRDSGAAPQLQ